ncbi:hypothetical protein I302_106006 [Kwoniella bestiolae CBS 10118]|uniref:Myb-like domain-containing protein n=1 Tax=Kwoniella bestiolae CBS 10118 TaxID=1296100 RepID=A0A1B9G2S4_9TREE|nr:hypothetical protein I302_05130 [Kwoniella bestiolae CBS 10118]OCF25315.1 hypothetical protein I302_05130 [Kwoniella bestiolae CBS 10118]
MSLRLPSQNKFRPTFKPGKPGQKKAPPVRPSNSTPTSSQQTIAPSSSQPLPSSSQTSAPSSSQPYAPSTSAPQPSTTSTAVNTQVVPGTDGPPQSTKSTNVVPKPIPSSQIRALLSNNFQTTNITPPVQSGPAPPASGEESTEVIAIPSSSVTAGPSTSQASTAKPPSSQAATSPTVTRTPLAPPPPPSPAPAPRLSLLDAARNHSSETPSPGQIRRRTPSIASRSERAPSATPQPQRAPSAAPSIRGSSVVPHSRREPSATPQPPTSSGAPPSLGVTPSPRQPPSSLPPSLGTAGPPTLGLSSPSGFPPSLGTTSSSPAPIAAPIASSSRDQAAALAAAAVGTIGRVGDHHTSSRQARKGRRRVTKGAAPLARNIPVVEIPIRSGKKPLRVVRENTEDRRTSEEDDGSEDEEVETGEKRKSSSQITEDDEGRHVKRQKKKRAIGVATISLQDIQPDELVGDQVDEVVITMGDLATTLAAQGKVSSRAIKIDEHRRAEDQKNKEAARLRVEQSWRRNQIKRRKVRHTKNRDRARRREELGRLGMDEGIVSQDEDDSEEEYEPEPERLTPESTPDPDARREQSIRPEDWDENGEGLEDGDEEYNDVPVDNNAEPLFMDGEGEGDEGDGEGENGGVGLTAEDIAAQEEADADMAALRELGINIVEDGPSGFGEAGDGEEDEEEYNWEVEDDYPDIEGYRRDLERDRRRIREAQDRDDGEVVEINDETRFINAASFAKYTKPQRWTAMETELFYQVLEETGENYSLMKAYFPGRTIKQLKLKGLKENRINPEKMTAAILARKPLDKDYLTKSSGFDATRAWDKEEALFEEAKNDADRLKRLDSTRPGEEGGEGEEGGNEFDETMLQEFEVEAEEDKDEEAAEEEKDGEDEEY